MDVKSKNKEPFLRKADNRKEKQTNKPEFIDTVAEDRRETNLIEIQNP